MNTQDIQLLYDCYYWANQKILAAISVILKGCEKIPITISVILSGGLDTVFFYRIETEAKNLLYYHPFSAFLQTVMAINL